MGRFDELEFNDKVTVRGRGIANGDSHYIGLDFGTDISALFRGGKPELSIGGSHVYTGNGYDEPPSRCIVHSGELEGFTVDYSKDICVDSKDNKNVSIKDSEDSLIVKMASKKYDIIIKFDKLEKVVYSKVVRRSDNNVMSNTFPKDESCNDNGLEILSSF